MGSSQITGLSECMYFAQCQRSVKENKYLRKRETTFKTVFQFGRLGFSSALIKQKKFGKKFMV